MRGAVAMVVHAARETTFLADAGEDPMLLSGSVFAIGPGTRQPASSVQRSCRLGWHGRLSEREYRDSVRVVGTVA
ncbi:hypothetical protein GUJ93_ZPchr0015g6902 [Zizania palustris]|uniref:Uncharacterized protein n=1 Tax=Zizania palustris TaxID=103762 RepID=A0A8J5W673_ZIZPA|nr:hypothetical protein GUJ93_ZPchr0015g6902 [Zizania palustris]